MDMIKLLGTSAFLAIALAAAPASAQILGGGGGLGGGLGGNIGGSGMGSLGSTIDSPLRRLPSTSDTTGSLRGSSHTEKNVNARKGHVTASNDSSLDSTVANSTRIGDRTIGGSGSASGNAGGSADAQLIGTDAVRGTASNAVGRTRDTVSNVRDRAGTATDRVRDTAGNAVSRTRDTAGNAVSRARNAVPSTGDVSGAASGAANGAGSFGNGTLALAGSAAANGDGAFPVSVGMPVTDAKGKLIGTVQSVRTAGRGTVQQVLVKVKDKTATLPATNFTGSGNALVSAMGKGEVKKSAD
jgi:hypothetical protein